MPNRSIKSHLTLQGFLWFIIALAFILRVIHLKADPPWDLSWSGGYFSDEGFWCHNARNLLVFGNESYDEWNNKYLSPATHYLSWLAFKLFGIGIAPIRFISVLCSILTLILVYKIFIEQWGYEGAMAMVICAAFNYLLIMYNRLWLLETPLILFIILTFFFFIKGERSFCYDILSGIFAFFAFMTKFFAFYIFFLVPLTLISSPNRGKDWIKRILFFYLGTILILIFWLKFIYLPHSDYINQYNRYYRSQQSSSLAGVVMDFLSNPYFVYMAKTPIILLFSTIGIAIITTIFIREKSKLQMSEIFLALWFLFVLLGMGTFRYRPLRYFLPLVIPMIGLAIYPFVHFTDPQRKLQFRFISLILMLPILFCGSLLIDKYLLNNRLLKLGDIVGVYVPGVIAVVVCGLILMTALFIWKEKIFRIKRLMVIYFILFIIFNISQYFNWLNNLEYGVFTTSRKLNDNLSNAVIAGQWSPVLCLQTTHRAIPLWIGYVNFKNPFEKYHITHFLLWDYKYSREIENFKENFPEVFARSRLIDCFDIKRTKVLLFEVGMAEKSDSD